LLLGALLGGCAAVAPPPPSSRQQAAREARATAPRAVDRNLSGFPLAFRQGYADGCGSAGVRDRHRDEGRYKNDLNYMMGWNDGYSVCRQ
jgi:hypothetical protein